MKYLTKAILFKACFFIAILPTLTGCAGDGYTMYGEVPTYQPNDPMLNCQQLGSELSLVDTAINDMNNSIIKLEKTGKSMTVMSSPTLIIGFDTPIPMAPSMIDQDVVKMKRAANSFQKRRDILIQQVYVNQCDDSNVTNS